MRGYDRDAPSGGGLRNSGACYVLCHGKDHGGVTYGGALRNSGNLDNWALKDDWQTSSWLLNNRPAVYKNGNGTNYRDANNDGYWWK